MPKVLLIGPRLCRNLGGPSLLPTTMQVIDKFIQGSQYTFITPTPEDLQFAQTYNLTIISVTNLRKLLLAALIKSIFGISVGTSEIRQAVEAFAGADIVIQYYGIWFADSLGTNTLWRRFSDSVHFFVGKLFRKPVVKYTADLGPFEAKWNRFFARLSLQYATDLILARNELSRHRLIEIGVTTPTIVCPDTAFLLDSRTSLLAEHLSHHTAPLVGFSISHQAAHQSGHPDNYLSAMAKLADYIAESIGAKIILIPNEISDKPELDDRYYTKEMWNRMQRQSQAIIVLDEYAAPELKGLVSKCDVVVASRYHTIIASLSQAIPVLVVGWHDKYYGAMELVGQTKYVCSALSLNTDELKERFNDLWQSRFTIKQEIQASLPKIHHDILKGGEAVSDLYRQKVTCRSS